MWHTHTGDTYSWLKVKGQMI